MNIVFYLIGRSRVSIMLAVIAGILSGLGSAALISLINTELHATTSDFKLTILLFGGLGLLVLLSQIVSNIVIMRVGQSAARDLRMELSRRIMSAPLHLLQQLGAPRLMANLTEDISVLIASFQTIPQMCINIAWVVGCLIYLAWLSLDLFVIALVIIGLGVVVYQLSTVKAMNPLQEAREQHDALYAHFRGLIHGIKEIKLHSRRRKTFLEAVLYPTAEACRREIVSAMTIFICAATLGTIFLYMLIGFIFFEASTWEGITREVITGYTLTVLYMMAPLTAVLAEFPTFSLAKVALIKINCLKKELIEEAEGVSQLKPEDSLMLPGILELVDVTHHYNREGEVHPFTLGPLNITFEPGELVFITGGNGSGKSTLGLLLVGLYSPENGQIRLNGMEINEAEQENYRQQFSVVFSDFYLFDSLLGLMTESLDQKARAYLKELQLDHKVTVTNGVFSTVELSQGQRKRLALVTAYLENRPFYVFDEWAADQDPLFKELFYTVILRDLKSHGKTVIVITHDDYYFHLADRCIRLENGQVIENYPFKSDRSHATFSSKSAISLQSTR